MVNIDFCECKVVCISAPDDDVLNFCNEFGGYGYLFDGEDGLTLITSQRDAARVASHFGPLAYIRDVRVRVSELPKGIRRLIRKKSTTSTGRIDGQNNEGRMWGWFHPDLVPGGKILILQGKKLLVETHTDVFRPDLFEAGIGEGVAAFICQVPGFDPNGATLTITNTAGEKIYAFSTSKVGKSTSLVSKNTPQNSTSVTRLKVGEFPDAAASGHYSAELDGLTLDYFITPGTSGRVIVFSPGFLDVGRFPYPYFQRMKWAQGFEDTCIFLADPTLLLGNTQIGWFVGDKTTHYLPVVAHYLEKLARARSVLPENILFFGSSAGGFSSIGFAAHIRGARALAVNPQTNALRLHSPNELAKTLKSCLGISDLGVAYRDYSTRFILSDMFRQLGNVPRITIWQNIYDRYHVEYHLLPFLQEIKDLCPTDTLEVHLTAQPDQGHAPPDLPIIKHLFWP